MNTDLEDLVEIITRQCEDEEGFINHLHTRNHFDALHWQIFVGALEKYALAVHGDAVVDRRVSGAVFFAYQIISNAMAHHSLVKGPMYELLLQAHPRIWELVEEIISGKTP